MIIILFSILLIIGCGLEYTALDALYRGTMDFMSVISLHALASAAFTLSLVQFKKYYRQFDYSIVLLLFLLLFFIPVLGIFGTFMIARWLCISQENFTKHTIKFSSTNSDIKPLRRSFGVGGLRVNLQEKNLPLASRISAFKTLSTISPEKVNSLVKTMLPDEQDEIRLLALYLLNKQEKHYISGINNVLLMLNDAKSSKDRAKLHKLLAHQYWELVTRNLVEANIVNYMLEQALSHAKQAHEFFDQDATICYLIARINHREKKYDEALIYFEKALSFGYSTNKIVPYLAEIFFLKRDFASIKKYIKNHAENEAVLVNRSLIDFWRTKNA